jgi:outer membrane protein
MKPRPSAILIAVLLSTSAPAARAQEPDVLPVPREPYRFFVHIGPAGLLLDESADIDVGGAPLAGADIKIDSTATAVVEVGYFILPDIAVSVTAGVPPTSDIEASGSLSGAGMMGDVTYGPAALTAHYHGLRLGIFEPYVGGGITYMPVFDSNGALVDDLEVDSAFGFVVQAGVDVMLGDRVGIFLDAKKAILRTDARGNIGGAPVDADVTLDPLVIHGGLTFRF